MAARPSLSVLRKKLGITLPDARLNQALTHGTSNQAGGPPKPKNSNLAFLGDAVIELAVRWHLFQTDERAALGQLSSEADKVVPNRHLAAMARRLELGKFLLVGPGASAIRENDTALADSLEAIFGAVFEQQGFPIASGAFIRLWKEHPPTS